MSGASNQFVICGSAPYDVFVGRGACPETGESSQWAVPGWMPGATREELAAQYRSWFWDEIKAGRIDLAELVSLHGKVFGAAEAPEGWHCGVLEAASMWSLIEQARRLSRVAVEKRGEKASAARSVSA
jgi:hypothetical protein